jgi:hypothetical protein
LACVAAARGDGEHAVVLLATAARWRDEAHRPASPLELHDIERAANRVRDLLGPDVDATAQVGLVTHHGDV